jgi:methionyl-tRNA formyltransferase
MAGDAETGVCIMRMEAGLDTGPVLLRRATRIAETETTGDLHDRLAALGAAAIVEALGRLDELPPEPQDDQRATYAPKVDKAEARVDWTRPAAEVDRLIRGLSPFPGAWCLAGGERLKLLRSRVVPGEGPPGQRLSGLTVACGGGAVEILQAQRAVRRPMPAEEVLRGADIPQRLG